MAQFMRKAEPMALIKVEDATIARFVAKSLSRKEVGKDDFQRIKDLVLNFLAALISVPVNDLSKASK